MSEVSSYVGPYARLRDVISTERTRRNIMGKGDYSQGYVDAMNMIEKVIAEIELETTVSEEQEVE